MTMNKKSIMQKIWTASPQSVFLKAREFFRSHRVINSFPDSIRTIEDGPARGAKLVIPASRPAGHYLEMVSGTYEDFIMRSLEECGPLTGKVVWDVGAHVGYQSLAFATKVGEAGSVIAFEPNPHNILIFKKNLKVNPSLAKHISIRDEALSDTEGTLTFKVSQHPTDATTSGGYLDAVTPPLPDSSYQNFTTITVSTTTVDALIKDGTLPLPDIIKIDIEGAELSALEGSTHFLETHKPIFIIEIHTIPMMLYVERFLRVRGYETRLIDESGGIFTKNIIAVPIQK